MSFGPSILYLLSGLLLGVVLMRFYRSYRARTRSRKGNLAEDQARADLESRGFQILESPHGLRTGIGVDGEWHEGDLRVDFLARYGGEEVLVEVKSTARAASPLNPDTRRQLREYWDASQVPLYLYFTGEKRLMRIHFEASGRRTGRESGRNSGWTGPFGVVFWAAGIGAGLGFLVGIWMQPG